MSTIPTDDSAIKSQKQSNKIEGRVGLKFQNISYSTKLRFFSKEKVNILKNINGEFKSGELTAIVGTSGAGKSTLLNILTGFITTGVTGEIYQNEKLNSITERGKSCSYIMQDINLHSLLTVEEVMNFSTDFKLPNSTPKEAKQKRVDVLLKTLGLLDCRKTLISNISGGEKRRLSICVELVQNPSILFLDEPTTGLDEVNTKHVISLLQTLAKEGRTVVCTIHQPSATILQKFDKLYCLEKGFCTYQGNVDQILPFLENFDPPLICPSHYNPADFLLDVCHGVYGNVLHSMVKRCQNGIITYQSINKRNTEMENSLENLQVTFESIPSDIIPGQKSNKKIELPIANTCKDYYKAQLESNGIYATSCLHQTKVIIQRKYTMIKRDKQHTLTRLFLSFITAVFVGIIYYKIGENGKHSIDNFNYIFFTTLWVMYSAFCSMLIVFTNEIHIVIKEHFNRWYSVKSYFIGITIADLPILLADVSIFIIISYFMTGQPLEWFRFGLFITFAILNTLVSQSVAMVFSAFFKFEIAASVGPMCMLPFTIFCGYFIHINDAPFFLRWVFDVSFLRYSVEGSLQAMMGFGRGKLECPELYCHFANPIGLMKQLGMEEPRILLDVCVLVFQFIFVKLIAYWALVKQIGGNR